MRFSQLRRAFLGAALGLAAAGLLGIQPAAAQSTLLNVSYDPTREFYAEYNKAFAEHWKSQTGETGPDGPTPGTALPAFYPESC